MCSTPLFDELSLEQLRATPIEGLKQLPRACHLMSKVETNNKSDRSATQARTRKKKNGATIATFVPHYYGGRRRILATVDVCLQSTYITYTKRVFRGVGVLSSGRGLVPCKVR